GDATLDRDLHQGVVPVAVELLADLTEGHQTVLAGNLLELVGDELEDTRPVVMGARQRDAVQPRHQVLDHCLDAGLPGEGAVAVHATLVVLVLRDDALQVLGALGRNRLPVRHRLPRLRGGGVGCHGLGLGGLLEVALERLLGGGLGLLVRQWADDFLVGVGHLSSPSPGVSSTISASTTSSWPAPPSVDSPPSVPDSEPWAPCAAWAAAYIAWPMAAALVFR